MRSRLYQTKLQRPIARPLHIFATAMGIFTSSLAIGMSPASFALAQNANQLTAKTPEVLELIVLYDDDESKQGAKSDDIIDEVKNPAKNTRNTTLNAEFDSPSDARHMIRQRLYYSIEEIDPVTKIS